MNLLHTLVATLIENFSTVTGILAACFHLGVALSYITSFACIAFSAHFFVRRGSRRVA